MRGRASPNKAQPIEVTAILLSTIELPKGVAATRRLASWVTGRQAADIIRGTERDGSRVDGGEWSDGTGSSN
jgi:hypothetical protein